MAGERVLSGSNFTALLQNQRGLCSSEPLDAFFLSGSSPSFLGSGTRSMLSFEDVNGGNRSDRSFFRPFNEDGHGDEDLDEYVHQPEKKRRLSADQVQFLERSFELENKLEPNRKIQLAKDLSLQPRQVAIWFQNRRARWKTKQLEKDYEALQASYNSLKANLNSLHEEKKKLKAEVLYLSDKLHLKEKEGPNSGACDAGKVSQALPIENSIPDSVSEVEGSKVSSVVCKLKDLSSVKSGAYDSHSPHCIDGVHSSYGEPGDSSNQSDLSQDEEDDYSKNLLPPFIFPKIEDADYPNPQANPCYFGFPVDDHHAFWSWSY